MFGLVSMFKNSSSSKNIFLELCLSLCVALHKSRKSNCASQKAVPITFGRFYFLVWKKSAFPQFLELGLSTDLPLWAALHKSRKSNCGSQKAVPITFGRFYFLVWKTAFPQFWNSTCNCPA
ncbi:hypothetical protein AVEN_144941-1 [Araneus ventricosus]|uniref:Uncharacterized protein n=1 Tax=Araneus ventricosus TaxID=182803 RepID=A0A4Y2W9N7_ARAVE|nr:hypothetical protein AVEN_144941-1 [Araneus ventricosus]